MGRIALPLLALWLALPALAAEPEGAPSLTAEQIVERNVAARGGLDAWRKIETMAWIGHIDSPNAPVAGIPFVLEQKRPNKTRFEIMAQHQLAMRLFDGARGWKVHPAHNGQPELQPYTPDELTFARDAAGMDGPLIDFKAKGISIALEGLDEVEGAQAYRLNVTLPSGASQHVWIDAQTFLEIKSDREAHNSFGMSGTVSVYYRDYRSVEGLQIPFLIESGSDTSKNTDKMVIDRVVLNPPLQDRLFAEPGAPRRRTNGLQVRADARNGRSRPAWLNSSRLPGHSGPEPGSLAGSGHAR